MLEEKFISGDKGYDFVDELQFYFYDVTFTPYLFNRLGPFYTDNKIYNLSLNLEMMELSVETEDGDFLTFPLELNIKGT